MSNFADREDKRKSVVGDIINKEEGKKKKEKKELVTRTYNIAPEHVKALAFKKAGTGREISDIVREALDQYFGDELEQYK